MPIIRAQTILPASKVEAVASMSGRGSGSTGTKSAAGSTGANEVALMTGSGSEPAGTKSVGMVLPRDVQLHGRRRVGGVRLALLAVQLVDLGERGGEVRAVEDVVRRAEHGEGRERS